MTETGSAVLLPAWEARCKSLGLLMTAPRRAILTAMLQSGTPRDAVTLLKAAREHHAATSIGTIYRLLREFGQHGLVHVQTQAHGRCRWCLCEPSQLAPAPDQDNVRILLRQVRRFLRELEKLGFAEAHAAPHASPGKPAAATIDDPVVGLLHEIAERSGYRLA